MAASLSRRAISVAWEMTAREAFLAVLSQANYGCPLWRSHLCHAFLALNSQADYGLPIKKPFLTPGLSTVANQRKTLRASINHVFKNAWDLGWAPGTHMPQLGPAGDSHRKKTTSQKIPNLAFCVSVMWILFGKPFSNFLCGYLGSWRFQQARGN